MRLVILAILAFATTAYADEELKFSAKPTFVLGGHLTIVLPAGARACTSKLELTAWRDETRFEVAVDDQQLAIVGQETYLLGTDKFAAAVKMDLIAHGVSLSEVRVEALRLRKPLQGYAVLPNLVTENEEQLVYAAYIKNKDNTVQVLSFFVDRLDSTKAGRRLRAAKKTVTSVQPGGRRLTSGGTQHLRFVGLRYAADVPAGWTTTSRVMDDRILHRWIELVPLGTAAPRCTLSDVRIDAPPTEVTSTETHGRILDQDVTWRESKLPDGTLLTTTVPPHGPNFDSLFISCDGLTDADVQTAKTAIESLRIVERQARP